MNKEISLRFVYDLPIPHLATAEEQELFHPKPLDGEVEKFEVNTIPTRLFTELKDYTLLQLASSTQ